jgi:hypothetical protein
LAVDNDLIKRVLHGDCRCEDGRCRCPGGIVALECLSKVASSEPEPPGRSYKALIADPSC